MAKETVAIVDYGSGNLHSAAKAFERMATAAGGRQAIVVSSDPDVVRTAGRIVLPGVGAFADCRAGLLAVDGMMAALTEAVIDGGKPFLGICVGMQLMASVGLEHGRHEGFGWIPGQVEAIRPTNGLKLPHMGWNDLSPTAHPVLAGIAPRRNAYFVHSYHLRCDDPTHIQAQVDYGDTITAAVGRDNLFGTQFHPEKSLETGMRLIANFLAWRP